jgi:hypothetical protein
MGVHCIPSTPGGDAPTLQYFRREKQICRFFFFSSMYLLYVVWMRATFSTFMPIYSFCLEVYCSVRRCNSVIVIFYLYMH